jgi:hypothetical protein
VSHRATDLSRTNIFFRRTNIVRALPNPLFAIQDDTSRDVAGWGNPALPQFGTAIA